MHALSIQLWGIVLRDWRTDVHVCDCMDPQIGLLNVGGFFDPILCWFDKALQFGVLDRANHDIVVSARTAVELLDKLEVII